MNPADSFASPRKGPNPFLTKESFQHLPTPLQTYRGANPVCSWASVGLNFLFCKHFLSGQAPPAPCCPILKHQKGAGVLAPQSSTSFPRAITLLRMTPRPLRVCPGWGARKFSVRILLTPVSDLEQEPPKVSLKWGARACPSPGSE